MSASVSALYAELSTFHSITFGVAKNAGEPLVAPTNIGLTTCTAVFIYLFINFCLFLVAFIYYIVFYYTIFVFGFISSVSQSTSFKVWSIINDL